jgi:hypothetical protein
MSSLLAMVAAPPAEAGDCWRRILGTLVRVGVAEAARANLRLRRDALRDYSPSGPYLRGPQGEWLYDGRRPPTWAYHVASDGEGNHWEVEIKRPDALSREIQAVILDLKRESRLGDPESGIEWGAFVVEFARGEPEIFKYSSNLVTEILEADVLGRFDALLERAADIRHLTNIHTHPDMDYWLAHERKPVNPSFSTPDLNTFGVFLERLAKRGGRLESFTGIVAPLGKKFKDTLFFTRRRSPR